jgi:signal transduction histidine kinase
MAFGALALALTATGLPGLWLSWRAYRALRAEVYDAQLTLARGLASEIDADLGQAINAVNALAVEPKLARDSRRLASRLALLVRASERLDDLLVCDMAGTVRGRASAEGAVPVFSAPERAALAREALAQPDQTVRTLHRTVAGTLVLRLARRLDRETVIEAQVLMESHGLGSLEKLRLGAGGFAYLVDEGGRPLVLSSRARHVEPDPGEALAFDFDGGEACRVLEAPGGAVLLAVAPVESLGWGVAVRRRLVEVELPARRMRRELAAFIPVALLLALGLALALAQPVVRGLESLVHAARSIEQGRPLSAAPGASGGDEVAEVARALTHLDAALRAQKAARECAYARALDAERRLAHSERLASLGQLTAGLAHELNNPLMVIQGSIVEAAALATPAARRWLERARREVERCTRLVRELLFFARPVSPKRRAFALDALLREAFENVRTGRSRPQRWRLELSGGPWRVQADREQLLRVAINLLANALDAMPEGGVVSAYLRVEAGGWKLRVRDQGPGVPVRQREAVFRPFYSGKPQGTGLGLAIARALMLGHGGSLRCLPVRGKGACFEAAWPRSVRRGGVRE